MESFEVQALAFVGGFVELEHPDLLNVPHVNLGFFGSRFGEQWCLLPIPLKHSPATFLHYFLQPHVPYIFSIIRAFQGHYEVCPGSVVNIVRRFQEHLEHRDLFIRWVTYNVLACNTMHLEHGVFNCTVK